MTLRISLQRVATLIGALLVAACGGGGGGGSDPGPTVAPAATSEAVGLWLGNTDSGRPMSAIVLGDGTSYVLIAADSAGAATGNVASGRAAMSAGSLRAPNTTDFRVASGARVAAALSASYVAGRELRGTLTSTAPVSSTAFTARYDTAFDRAASLAALAGTYSGTTMVSGLAEVMTLAFAANGQLTGVTLSGCRIAGSAAPRTEGNAFTLAFALVGGACSLGEGARAGVAAIDSNGRLHIAAMDVAEQNAFAVLAGRVSDATHINNTFGTDPFVAGGTGSGVVVPLQAALADLEATSFNVTVRLSGARGNAGVDGVGHVAQSAPMTVTFEGQAAERRVLATNVFQNLNGTNTQIATTTDLFSEPGSGRMLGRRSDEDYNVATVANPLPVVAAIGASGRRARYERFVNETDRTNLGVIEERWVLEPDTTSSAVVNLVSIRYDANGQPQDVAQLRLRVTNNGTATFASLTVTSPNARLAYTPY